MDNDKSSRWNLSSDEDAEPSSADIFQKPPDFFQSFMADRLASLRGSENSREDDSESDDDDEETSPPKKKPIFNDLFKTFSPDSKPNPAAELNPADSENDSVVPSTVPETEALSTRETPPSDRAEEPADALPEQPLMTKFEEPRAATKELSDEEVVKIEHPQGAAQEAINDDQKKPELSVTAQNSPDQNYIRYAESGGAEHNAPPRSERISTPQERGGGALLAFLGAEFLSRRRDRKLSKEIKTKEKEAQEKIEHLKKSQLTQKEAQETLRIHQQKQIDKIAAAQAKEASSKTTQNLIRQPEYRPPSIKNERIDAPASIDRPISPEFSDRAASSADERLIKYEQIHPQPEHSTKYEADPQAIKEVLRRRYESILPTAADQELLVKSSSRRRRGPHYVPDMKPASLFGNEAGMPSTTTRMATSKNKNMFPETLPHSSSIPGAYTKAVGAGIVAALLILLLAVISYYLR